MFMRKNKLLICDWDGTIVDSVKQIVSCKQFLAKKYNLNNPDESTIRSVLGMDFYRALALCFPLASDSLLKEIGAEFQSLMMSDLYNAEPYPACYETLQYLKTNGYLLAVATAKSRAELEHSMTLTGLNGFFDMTCCAEEHQPKPNPVMLQHILSLLNVDKNSSVFIGDTITDVLFSKNARMKSLCVTFGAQHKNLLEEYKPFGFVDNWYQVPDLVDKLILMSVVS